MRLGAHPGAAAERAEVHHHGGGAGGGFGREEDFEGALRCVCVSLVMWLGEGGGKGREVIGLGLPSKGDEVCAEGGLSTVERLTTLHTYVYMHTQKWQAFKKNFSCNGAITKDEEVGDVIQLSGT